MKEQNSTETNVLPVIPGVLNPSQPHYGSPQQQTPVDPDVARKKIESRQIPGNVFDPNKLSSVRTLASGLANNTVLGTASIAEQARALKNDVDLIFEFVAGNIEFLPTYGQQKSGFGALLDGYGNAFDQADLMVQLLRQAGYSANYLSGEIELDGTQLASWLGTDPLNVWSASNLLANCGVPNSVVSGSPDKVRLSHLWVKVQIGAAWFVFDPSMKTYTTKAGVNLATAMGYNATTFMNDARSGGTVAADYVQNLNRSNVRSNLANMTGNLVSWIKTNQPSADVNDILGGRLINSPIVGGRLTTLPYQRPGATPTEWTSIPNSYKTTFHVAYDSPNIDVTFYSADLVGKRLTLFFNASHQAELRLNGTLIATSSAQGVGTWNSVLLEVVHPYSSTFADTYVWERVWADKGYLIGNAFGNCKSGQTESHRRKFEQAKFDGFADTAEPLKGEALAVIWHAWNAQKSQVSDLINRMTLCTTALQHQAGLVGYYDTLLTDLGGIVWSSGALDNNYDRVKWNDDALALHGVMLEASVLKQEGGVTGISSTPLIDQAISSGLKVYDGKTANWNSTVKPALTGYSTADLTTIENWYINAGWRVALPENGALTNGSWTGLGYFARSPWQGALGIIGGGLKGSSGNLPITEGFIYVAMYEYPDGSWGFLPWGGQNVGEPVDPAKGTYITSNRDLSVGAGNFPYSLSVTRAYSGTTRMTDGPLGLGWTHNFLMTAKVGTDALQMLGDKSVLAATPGIVELFVCVDLFKDLTRPHDKFVTAVLANQWLSEQLSQNTVVVQNLLDTPIFTKLPDGSYVPPFGNSGTLVKNVGGTFTYKTALQVVYNFNANGDLSTIVYPFGVTVTLSYTSGKLTSVTNGLGRTLTFNYTGTRLTSISDGTGRSVSYTVDSTKNLTQFANALGQATVYSYDIPGRLEKVYMPANPTTAVLTNVFDSLGRVKQQKDPFNNVTEYYLAGSRVEIVDPNGVSGISYRNRFRNSLKKIDGAGKVTEMVYDGLQRLVKYTLPEGNSRVMTYDARNNLLSIIAKAKPSSGLADITRTYTYHSTFNKRLTAVDGLGRTTNYSYDATTGLLTQIQYPAVGGISSQVSFSWNTRGQLLTKTDQSGIVTRYDWDSSTEKLNSIVHDFGTGRLNLTNSYGYNTVGDVTSLTDARGKTSNYAIDALRRVTQLTAAAPFSYVSKLTYDANGNVTKTELQTDDPLNPWQTTTATYSPLDELLTVVDPSGYTATVAYTASRKLWKITDAESRVREFAYDSRGLPYTLKDPSGTIAMTKTYSDNGLLASMKDARNNVTSFTQDGHDRASKTIFPDSSYTQCVSYDANNNVLTFRKRSGNTIVTTYDELNRQKTKTPQGQPTTSFTYDLANRLTKLSVPVISGDPSTGDFSFFFDTAGRFFKEQYPDGKTVISELDANGNITKTTYPDGWYLQRVFDELNRFTDIKLNGATSSAIQFQYDALSRRKKLVYENGCSVDYGFETDSDVNSIIHTFVGSALTLSLTHNNVHQLLTQQFSDNQYSWHPSPAGTVTYGTANSVNQYPSVAGTSYTYSTDACLTGDGVWTFGYNTEQMLTTATKTGTSLSFKYDPLLRQVQKQLGSTKSNFYYGGLQRLADYDGAGVLQQRYVYGSELDEVLLKVVSAGTKTYYHHDVSGSVIALTNAAGSVTNRYKYSPFGESPSLSGTTHGYTGQRVDSESGLYYYKNRYYSPALGRFLQPDPIGYAGGINLYTYVENDPLNSKDPLGLTPTGNTNIDGWGTGYAWGSDPAYQWGTGVAWHDWGYWGQYVPSVGDGGSDFGGPTYPTINQVNPNDPIKGNVSTGNSPGKHDDTGWYGGYISPAAQAFNNAASQFWNDIWTDPIVGGSIVIAGAGLILAGGGLIAGAGTIAATGTTATTVTPGVPFAIGAAALGIEDASLTATGVLEGKVLEVTIKTIAADTVNFFKANVILMNIARAAGATSITIKIWSPSHDIIRLLDTGRYGQYTIDGAYYILNIPVR